MPGADEGGHSPTRASCAARAPDRGPRPRIPGARPARATDPARRGLLLPSPAACRRQGSTRLVDLGSGGGLPGLVVATEWPEVTLALLGGQRTPGRLPAPCGRASGTRRPGHGPGGAGRGLPGVTRASGPGSTGPWPVPSAARRWWPSVPLPCLRVGGWLLVSEPPRAGVGGEAASAGERRGEAGERWPAEPLRQFGLEPAEVVHRGPSSTARCARWRRAPTASPGATGSRPRSPSSESRCQAGQRRAPGTLFETLNKAVHSLRGLPPPENPALAVRTQRDPREVRGRRQSGAD